MQSKILLVVALFALAGLVAARNLNAFDEDLDEKLIVATSPTSYARITRGELYSRFGAGEKLRVVTKIRKTAVNPPNGTIPSKLTQQGLVHELIPEISTDYLQELDQSLANYFTRYYKSQTGVQAAEYLHNRYRALINNVTSKYTTVQYFNITQGPQPNVICRIQGTGTNANERVIIGGHLDSVTWPNPANRSPGADDDGSGSSTVFEIFRVLALNNWRGSRTVEFHGYAAEEVGLLGSQAIADSYAAQNIPVVGMLQLDMVGYPNPSKAQSVVIDLSYTTPQLNKFLEKCANEYCAIPWVNGECGYACSDQASWTEAGYPASFLNENGKYPYIHTSQDSTSHIDYDYMSEFAKLGLGFVVELAAYQGQ